MPSREVEFLELFLGCRTSGKEVIHEKNSLRERRRDFSGVAENSSDRERAKIAGSAQT